MAIVTEPFLQIARTQARVGGRPDHPFIVVPHPTCRLSRAQVYALADGIFEQVVKGLLEPESVAGGNGQTDGGAGSEVVPTSIHVAPTLEAANEAFLSRGWGDGLPIVPPTRERVDAMLRGIDCDPGHSLGVIPPRMGQLTIEKIAVNAVMAGCRPEYMPVVVTAIEAMLEPQFNLAGVQATQNEVAPLIIVHGPIARELNVNNGAGLFGPCWQANASIGRAIRLVMLNVGGAQPGTLDKSTMGASGKFTQCIAEIEDVPEWAPLIVDRGFPRGTDAVTVIGTGSPQVSHYSGIDTTLEILDHMAHTLRTAGTNAIAMGPEIVLIVAPELVRKFTEDGYPKEKLRRFLWEHSSFADSELYPGLLEYLRQRRPERFRQVGDRSVFGIGERPEDFFMFVAGSQSGPQSVFIPTYWSRAATRPITRRAR